MHSTATYGLSTKVHYENSTTELKKTYNVIMFQDELGRKHFEIHKIDKTYVNNQELTLLLDQLAEKCYETIFPLRLIKENDLTPIQITNRNDVLYRWNSTRSEIEEYFKGDLSVKYCDKFDEIINNEILLNQYLQNDVFIFYFTQLKTILGKSYSNNYQHDIPIQPTLELPFVTKETFIADNVNEDDLVYFEIESEMNDNYSNSLIFKLINHKLLVDTSEDFSWNYTLNGYISQDKKLHNLTMIITFGILKQTKIEIDIAKMT